MMSVFEKNNKFFISDNAYVFSVNTNSEGFPEHKHDFVEMVYMLKGKCVHIIDGKEYPVRRGDLVIINYHQTHSIKSSDETTYVNILMKPEYINKSLTNHENAFALLHLSEFEDFRKILDESKCKVSFEGEERSLTGYVYERTQLNNGIGEWEMTINVGEKVDAINRIPIMISPEGQALPIMIPIVLLG